MRLEKICFNDIGSFNILCRCYHNWFNIINVSEQQYFNQPAVHAFAWNHDSATDVDYDMVSWITLDSLGHLLHCVTPLKYIIVIHLPPQLHYPIIQQNICFVGKKSCYYTCNMRLWLPENLNIFILHLLISELVVESNLSCLQ